jgi:hypothetical protein
MYSSHFTSIMKRVLFLGDGRAGKSAVVACMKGEQNYVPLASTVGINTLTCNVHVAAVGSGKSRQELHYLHHWYCYTYGIGTLKIFILLL